ncbi:hemagglutinin repeat-containing protein [Burkholderia gladioli]|uniref:hemagglutinin repeat-containing protein n=2 Tax=Burkholderia gladioli TaxID=28095 RepID=UPI0016421F7E|nr:hemagglutinin repeat-containing protein [Burkholderia gladioli]MBJ9673759.1 hemagglutinin repeat-containing protein [Burkholderia gladioli]MDN7463844.1 hemagglutinin repeat-containing protein [Burkholderia gladioli]
MNKNAHRLVYSRLRGMVMAVAETTTAEGKSASGEARRVKRSSGMRAAAVLAASAVAGALSTPVQAQIVGAGPSAPTVIQTPNGLPQVNINKPGGSGVSVNTYNQFDVQKAGAILNNSATMVQTQLGGWINGNPNFGPNDAARIIVNQVNSPNPSQIRGALEIAGARAELVLANPSGIYLDGAGFINTSRATLTTGMPFYGADGSLVGYNVNRGLVTVAGAGLNASNLDQVDIISRAVQANAAIYAKNLNVIAGANQVNHDTLAATPIAGDGPVPAVAIDVAQLGGMYANRVFLVGNSAGVGVANAGTIAAQAGDLTLQSNGRLVLTGKTTASGNLALSAANGIQNSGTTYAQQSLSASIGTDLTNSGTLAAQQDTSVNAGSVNSTGTLGAGVNNDGAVGHGGDLNLTASGQLSATGQNAAGGNASLTGAGVNLAGSQTTANGNLSLDATAGDVNLSSATTSAQGTVNAKASGTVINDHGSVSSGGSMTLTGANLSNHGGTITQYGSSTMGMIVSGTLDNSASGVIQTNATDLTLTPAELDNAGGIITHGGIGTLTIAPGTGANADAGALNNASGTIVTKGQAIVQATGWNNAGGVLAAQGGIDATISGHLNNAQGLLRSDASLSLTSGGALSNQGGKISSTHDLSIAAATLQGGGTYSATHDANVHLQGDYTAASDTQFNVGHDLAFTLPGTFTNNASLQSVNTLSVNAGNIVNAGALTAGGLLHTQSTNLTNTGALVGASASLNATNTISNLGPAALIGASDSNGTLDILARDIENRDDTTATDSMATTAIFGMGKVVLAGGKDASGSYTNAALVNNVSALIQSGSDMELHADKVTSTRRVMKTSTSQIEPASLAQFGVLINGRTGQIGVKDPDSIGGVYTEPPHGGQWNSDYQFTTYYADSATATTVTDLSPAAQIVSGGKIDASSVGTLQNYWSDIAAVGDVKMPARYDADGWAASGQKLPGVTVSYSGQYHYNNYDNTEHDWQLPFGNAPFVTGRPGGYTQAAPASLKDYTLPGYFSTLSSNGTISGTGASVNNTAGNASIPPLGLLPGQSVPGLTPTKLSGNASGAKSGASSVHGGPSAPVDPILASATALNVLNNLTIPQGGLFKPTAAPNASYVIETNPAFTNQKNFISSDYFFNQIGVDLTHIPKRLGDGFYEQQLVRNQVTSLTGKAVLGPYADLQTMYESLMAAGADLSKSLDLPIGASLSADQVAKLTSNVILMETRVVDGQSVLVPVVYLARASQQDMNGPLIAATNIDLQNAQSFTNSGTITADNTLAIQGKQIDNAFGALQSGGLIALSTENNIDLTSANVKAGSLQLDAGKDLILDTATKTNTRVSRDGATSVVTTLGPTAKLDVAGDASITTGGNFQQNAGDLSVGGNLGMNVGGNWDPGAVQTGEHKIVQRANGVSNTDINKVTGSSVSVGGQSSIGVGGDLTARGAQIDLGQGGTLAAKGTVTLGTASATSTVNSNSSGSDSHGSYAETLHTSDQTLTGTTLKGGDTVNIVSGKDITLSGSAISLDKGNANLLAAGDVNVGAVSETHALNSHETHSHSNVVSGVKVASGIDQTMTLNRGSLVSADGVNIVSGKDVNVQGSTLVGTNDVTLTAAHNVRVTTSQDTLQSSNYYDKKESGLMSGGGLSVSVGSSSLKTTSQTTEVSNNGSTIGSLKGNLSIAAGNDLHVTGSDLIAAQNLSGTGANVTVDAAQDTRHRGETQDVSKSGLTLALKAPVIDAVSNAVGQSRAAGRSQDGRAAALHGMAAASAAWDANMAAGDLVNTLGAGETPQFKVEVSVGSSHSKSAFSEDSVTNRGSSVMAGGTAAFAATGNGQPGSGNVMIAGSNVNANDVILAAKNQVNIVNTTDTDSTRSTNDSRSASVGVSVGTGGFGVSAAMSKASGDGNSDLVTQNNSHVSAANSVTIISGGDTNLIGSTVKGNQVNADVGGNLNIASVQDTLSSAARQSSSGGGFSISQGGASGNFSQSKGNASGSYAGVNEQAGIHAGDGGFNVNVAGNTDLKGGLIASDADASRNSLTTGSLSFSDVQNQSHYDASSNGFSAGATTGDGGMNYSTHGSASGKNAGGAAPMLGQNDSGRESATTKSGVSAGTVTIRDSVNQKQDVASLNRDTTNTNGTVSKLPDMQNLLSNQADVMAAASAAGEAVSRRIGDYADKMMKEAGSNGDKAGVDAWKEGGANRALMQGAGAALVTGLAGDNAVGGAAGAAIASIASGKLNELSGAIAGSDPTGDANMNQALGNIVANALATGAGAAVGGESGVFSGYNVDRFNRQLHTEEKALAKQLAEKSKGKYTQAQIEDQMRIMGVSDARDGAVAPGTSEELNGRAPSDPSAGWLNTGLSNENGNPLIIQVMSEANPALQNFIMENYNSAAQGQVPSTYTYAPTPVGLDVWGAVANAAGSVSTAAGRFGAVTAAGATIPSPYAPGLATAAYVATVTGMVADAVVQVVKPDVGKYWTNSGGAMISDRLSTKYPLATPIINEAANNFNGSRLSQSIQDFINSSWARIVNQPENK